MDAAAATQDMCETYRRDASALQTLLQSVLVSGIKPMAGTSESREGMLELTADDYGPASALAAIHVRASPISIPTNE